ncbi:SDR family NAD(P)-dependent oxidoreductase, partial [Herbaspirillum sp. HC18]
GLGASPKDARIAADLAETAVEVITDAEAIGTFEALGEDDLFDLEYWSLEQAKLKGALARPCTGQVVAITGGGGGIGRATASAFAADGACVAILDRDDTAAQAAARDLNGLGLACDVTDPGSVQAAFARIVEVFGGLDVLVSNA